MENNCKCGCGKSIPERDKKGRPRRYFPGHGNVNKLNKYVVPREKHCNGCNRLLPINSFYLRNYKTCSGSNCQRPRSRCIACEKIKVSEWQKLPQIKISKKEARQNDYSIKRWIQERLSAWRKKTKLSDLTTEYLIGLWQQQEGKCYYTNEKLKILKGEEWKKDFHDSISLDRLSPSIGYVKGNVVFCQYLVNTMKGKLTEHDFYKKMRVILSNKAKIELSKPNFCSKLLTERTKMKHEELHQQPHK